MPPLEPLQKTLLLSLVSPVRVEHGSAHPPLGRELRFNRGSSLRGDGIARSVLFSPLGRVVRETPSRRRRTGRVGVRRGALLRAFPGVARVFAVVHFPALTTARSRLRVVSSLRPIAGASAAAAVASLDASLAFAPLLPLRLLALLRELALLLAVQNSAPSSPPAPTAAATVAARAARPALLPEIALLESGRALFRGGQLELVAHPARQRGPIVPGPAPASAPAAAPAEPTHHAVDASRELTRVEQPVVSCRRHPRAATSLGDEKRREGASTQTGNFFTKCASSHKTKQSRLDISHLSSLISRVSSRVSRLASRVSHAPEPARCVAQKGERRVHARARSAARYLPKKNQTGERVEKNQTVETGSPRAHRVAVRRRFRRVSLRLRGSELWTSRRKARA